MPAFVPGQRWISDTEPELGLGLVLALEGNRLTMLFVAAGERRTYAANNAPLTRVRFEVGDCIETQDGLKLVIQSLEEHRGIITYGATNREGQALAIEEMDLDHSLQFNKPQDRLFTGQLDSEELFSLRHETLRHLARLEQSDARGLLGGRISLIPHQLYIAHEVARREAPRVLLADEVGLGKTIEAGMIVHHQLVTGRADRILILVPDALLHQWLVEMRRRFNLRFSLFDRSRLDDLEIENPFLSEQLVLAGLECLMADPRRQSAALEGQWDLVVVDEAHHLGWSEDRPSDEYQFVAQLSARGQGLLLLTATPEQLGKQGHFARLRLLDPDRFHRYETFLTEERDYIDLAETLQPLLDGDSMRPEQVSHLRALLAQDLAGETLEQLLHGKDDAERETAREAIIQVLLDRHGTGRVLFRNTRATIKGFPQRQLLATALQPPQKLLEAAKSGTVALEKQLHPESLLVTSGSHGYSGDPRVSWLTTTLKTLRPAKVLVICALSQTVILLEEALRQANIPAALFHEGLSILERDRAAAWFSDEDGGAQVLICSEIGSEGRNFQFAHHLVLFDLPLNADLLEQRIGRLDRIGQSETIRIHVPYFKDTPQEGLFEWYQRGLNAFEHLNPAAQTVHEELRGDLMKCLVQGPGPAHQRLLDAAKHRSTEILDAMHRGRDRLLEINSCRDSKARHLVDCVEEEEHNARLWPYLERIFDAYGVTVEEHSAHCLILRPGEHMRLQFPELPDEGLTVTLDRPTALAREEVVFLTWEHPMVRDAMDLIQNHEHGNASLAILHHDDLEPGQLLIECYHVIESSAPRRLHVGRFFPPRLIRTLVEASGEDLSQLREEDFVGIHRHFDREHAVELLRNQRKSIERGLKVAERRIAKLLPGVVAEGTQRMLDAMTVELKRLAALRKVNPTVRQEELDQMKSLALDLHASIQASRSRLDSIRVIITA